MRLRILQLLVLALLVVAWYVLTAPGLIPPFYFEQDNRAAFFFGEPQKVFWVIVDWFWSARSSSILPSRCSRRRWALRSARRWDWGSVCGWRSRPPRRR